MKTINLCSLAYDLSKVVYVILEELNIKFNKII